MRNLDYRLSDTHPTTREEKQEARNTARTWTRMKHDVTVKFSSGSNISHDILANMLRDMSLNAAVDSDVQVTVRTTEIRQSAFTVRG